MDVIVRGAEDRAHQSLPPSARTVRNGAFAYMDRLRSVRLNPGLEAIGDPGCARQIPTGSRLIVAGHEAEGRAQSGAFVGSGIERVTFPDSL